MKHLRMGMTEGGRLSVEQSHDLRDALAITKGWLEVLFRSWDDFGDAERRELVAAALLGANQLCTLLDILDGKPIDLTESAHEKVAEEFLRLAE